MQDLKKKPYKEAGNTEVKYNQATVFKTVLWEKHGKWILEEHLTQYL